MKSDRFLVIVTLAVAAITLIAVAATFVTMKDSQYNSSEPSSPQLFPTAAPGNLTVLPPADVAPGPRPEKIIWYGSVQDSFGKPFGDVNVTLHLMTPEGEAFNLTSRSAGGLPYPGSYEFDDVRLTPEITYAYAEADVGDLEDDIHYYGKSENYTLDSGRVSAGFIVLHVPMPDSIRLTAENSTLIPKNVAYVNQPGAAAGAVNETIITAQLYLNGKPYKRSGVTITFSVDDEDIAVLPGVRTNITDETGRATILLTGSGAGKTNVTGYTRISISMNLSDTCPVQVID